MASESVSFEGQLVISTPENLPSGFSNHVCRTIRMSAEQVAASMEGPPTLSRDWMASSTSTSVFSLVSGSSGSSLASAVAA